uniref:GOLD domain-containing protein n=1 Tax=Micromonas pusilla TaxID=38833 RepID=A0A7S0D460_MICPS|mmetsp:Transcript_334/g.1381  ORF Transcript_334/g.1381 Transcript_334/m.1381 type:complete len:216 (+) Transcript_334:67-714(+)
MRASTRFLAFAAIAVALLGSATAMEFDLVDRGAPKNHPEENMKCVLEELAPSTLVMFTYESPDGTHLNLKLYDPEDTEIYSDTDSPEGSYGFTTELEGDYKACFYKTNVDKEDLKNHKVRLDWKTGVAVADWEKIAKAEKVDTISSTLRSLEAEMREIHNGMLFLRQKEAELRDLNESTNTRVAWLSFVSLAVCIGLCVWQILYLKQFFQRKKLL